MYVHYNSNLFLQMEELIRIKRQKYANGPTSLPKIQCTDRYLKQVYNCENAFKLCRAGARKTKFINFDLKYTQDQKAMVPCRRSIKIPLLIFKQNKFSPYKNKVFKQTGSAVVKINKLQVNYTQRGQVYGQGYQIKFTRNNQLGPQSSRVYIT